MGQGNVTKIIAKFAKYYETESFQSFVVKNVYKINLDLHVVTNVWSTFCRVRYVVCNITVKPTMNSDTDGKIITVTIGKV